MLSIYKTQARVSRYFEIIMLVGGNTRTRSINDECLMLNIYGLGIIRIIKNKSIISEKIRLSA